jgi:hypothetical protein
MNNTLNLDYYYGLEAEQFTFYRIPRLLIKDERFKDLSNDAKLLYGLSMKSGWVDEQNRAYIIYSIDGIMEDLGCGNQKATKVLSELDSQKGIGLIEKVRRGLGKPDIIYVKNFASIKSTNRDEKTPETQENTQRCENHTSRNVKTTFQEMGKSHSQKCENHTSRNVKITFPEMWKSHANYNYNNNTEYNNINNNIYNNIYPINHINQSESEQMIDEIDDSKAYIEIIKENLDYEHHMRNDDDGKRCLFVELYETICDVVCHKRRQIRIGGEDYPYETVREKFLQLRDSHLEYVIACMKNTTKKIANIKQYMITALYNSLNTINHYYQQEVNYDMNSGFWENQLT